MFFAVISFVLFTLLFTSYVLFFSKWIFTLHWDFIKAREKYESPLFVLTDNCKRNEFLVVFFSSLLIDIWCKRWNLIIIISMHGLHIICLTRDWIYEKYFKLDLHVRIFHKCLLSESSVFVFDESSGWKRDNEEEKNEREKRMILISNFVLPKKTNILVFIQTLRSAKREFCRVISWKSTLSFLHVIW